MGLDRKTLAGAAGAIRAAVVYNVLGGDEADNGRKRPKPSSAKTRLAEQAQSVSVGTVNINQAPRGDLLRLKHIAKARAKRILASRPFKSVEELVSRGASFGSRSGTAPGSSDGVMLPSL
jgi:competence protein ComEA